MQSFRKVCRAVSLGLALPKVNQQYCQTVNRILEWVLVAAIIVLIASEEHSRRTWRDRASEAQVGLARAALEISALRLAANGRPSEGRSPYPAKGIEIWTNNVMLYKLDLKEVK